MHTFIKNLLNGQAVEWKPLWEVTIWDKKFNAVDKSKQQKIIKYHYYLANDLKPLIVNGGDVKILTTSITDLWTTQELAGDNVSDGEVVAIPWGGNPVVQYYKGKFITADNRIATSKDINILDNKFLYYCLINKLDLIASFYRGSGIKHPSMAHVLDLQIPIPPLSVQSQIVQILDTFTELNDQLTAELSMRQKQYQYYRDFLLSEHELAKVGFEWKSLGEVFHLKNGYTPSKSNKEYWENGTIPWFRMEDIRENGRILDYALQQVSESAVKGGKLFPANSIIMATTATIGEHALVTVNCLSNQQLTNFSIKNEFSKLLDIKFAFHYFFIIDEQAKKIANKSSMPIISLKELSKLLIPIPPLSVQSEIVAILDTFDTLVSSISEGLPKEIQLRQKQYEYYRELLLDFHPNQE